MNREVDDYTSQIWTIDQSQRSPPPPPTFITPDREIKQNNFSELFLFASGSAFLTSLSILCFTVYPFSKKSTKIEITTNPRYDDFCENRRYDDDSIETLIANTIETQ